MGCWAVCIGAITLFIGGVAWALGGHALLWGIVFGVGCGLVVLGSIGSEDMQENLSDIADAISSLFGG